MHPSVLQQLGVEAKALAAVHAAKTLVTSVHSLVLQQGGTLREALLALAAREGAQGLWGPGRRGGCGPGPRWVPVDALVLQQVGTLAEAAATLGAAEGLLARVHPPVLLQPCAARKALAAVLAHEGPLLAVCELVAEQVRAAAEAPAAFAAQEGTLACVCLLVPPQVAAEAEHLPTHVAAATSNRPRARAWAAPGLAPGNMPLGSG